MQSQAPIQIVSQALLTLIPLVLSLTVHEFAHAWAAKKMGDDTAERSGRLTLNPIAHADPMGTILLPLFILMLSGATGAAGAGIIPLFGWAKPTPVDPGRFKRKMGVRTAMSLVSAAGPVSNLVMAFICAFTLSAIRHFPSLDIETIQALTYLLMMLIFMNIGLAVFNLLPLRPLDGESIVSGFLSTKAAFSFAQFNQRYANFILILIVVVPQTRELLSVPIGLIASVILTVTGVGGYF